MAESRDKSYAYGFTLVAQAVRSVERAGGGRCWTRLWDGGGGRSFGFVHFLMFERDKTGKEAEDRQLEMNDRSCERCHRDGSAGF